MRKTWTDTDAQRLKALREQAGTDLSAFAKRHALSAGQVRELEGGKPGSFYSDDIKAHTGRKLLTALGYVAPPEPDPEPVPDPAPEPELKAQPAPPPQPEPEPAPLPETVAAPEPEPDPATVADPRPEPRPDPATAASPGNEAGAPEPTPAPPRRMMGPMMALVVFAAIGVGLVLTTGDRGNSAVSTVTVDVAASPALTADSAASAPEAPASAAATASAPASAPVPVAVASAAKLPAGCEPTSKREATTYQSPVADKPASYLYVESIQPARVCVIDSRNQARLAVLKPGESINVGGVPPFTVRSAQWNDLKVFFQGLRVQLDPGAASDNVVILPK